MESKPPIIVLNNGKTIPQIGLGTFSPKDGDVKQVVKSAIMEHGYRLINTSRFLGNEELIGEAL